MRQWEERGGRREEWWRVRDKGRFGREVCCVVDIQGAYSDCVAVTVRVNG